jgi:hypothetical protein
MRSKHVLSVKRLIFYSVFFIIYLEFVDGDKFMMHVVACLDIIRWYLNQNF